MNIINAITRLIAIIAAMTAIVVWFVGATARTDASLTTTIKIYPRRSVTAALPSIGKRSVEMPPFSVVIRDRDEQDTEPVRARLQLYDAQGNPLAGSREVYLSFGEFRSFKREDVSTGTGRIEVRGEITYRLVDAPEQTLQDRSHAALELVDSSGEPILRRDQSGFAKNGR